MIDNAHFLSRKSSDITFYRISERDVLRNIYPFRYMCMYTHHLGSMALVMPKRKKGNARYNLSMSPHKGVAAFHKIVPTSIHFFFFKKKGGVRKSEIKIMVFNAAFFCCCFLLLLFSIKRAIFHYIDVFFPSNLALMLLETAKHSNVTRIKKAL